MHQIPALLLQLHLLGEHERARVCLCVSPSCWTSSRPPPIYREACSGTRAHIVGSRGSRWGNHGQRGSRGGVVRALCLRNHIVPPRQSVGAVRRRAQVGTDQVCDRGRCSLLGLCGRKSQSWKFGVFGVRALCGLHPPVCVCVWVGWVGGGVSTG